jgi:hypothetical protein
MPIKKVLVKNLAVLKNHLIKFTGLTQSKRLALITIFYNPKPLATIASSFARTDATFPFDLRIIVP